MEILFVQGPEKTGTSTLTGILNCHPEIFILFENYVAQPAITKYGHQFLERYPEARRFYRSEKDYGKPVREIFNYLEKSEPEYRYKYGGTKINSLDPMLTQQKTPHKVIFMMRDLKSWLVKENVIKIYRTDLDVVIPSVEYLRYLIRTTRVKNGYRLRLEDLIEKNDQAIDRLSLFLGMPLRPYVERWWEKIAKWGKEDPKSVFRLDHVHHSSRVKPGKLDTTVELLPHPFWKAVHSISEKYQGTGNGGSISESERQEDLSRLERLQEFAPLPYRYCYSYVRSIRFGFKAPREVTYISDKNKKGKTRSYLSKLLYRAKRIMHYILSELTRQKTGLMIFTFYDEFRMALKLLYLNFH